MALILSILSQLQGIEFANSVNLSITHNFCGRFPGWRKRSGIWQGLTAEG
jgi:hypothetical protein